MGKLIPDAYLNVGLPRMGAGSGFETAASMDVLAAGRAREASALANEAAARGNYLKTLDLLCLRNIAAIHQRVFPGPHADGLERV